MSEGRVEFEAKAVLKDEAPEPYWLGKQNTKGAYFVLGIHGISFHNFIRISKRLVNKRKLLYGPALKAMG